MGAVSEEDLRYGNLVVGVLGATLMLVGLFATLYHRQIQRWRDGRFRLDDTHPLHMLAIKTFCDGAVTINRLAAAIASYHGSLHAFCPAYVIVEDFVTNASFTWLLLLALDLYVTLRNPFTSPGRAYPFYHLLAWGVAAGAVGLLTVAVGDARLIDVDASVSSLCHYYAEHRSDEPVHGPNATTTRTPPLFSESHHGMANQPLVTQIFRAAPIMFLISLMGSLIVLVKVTLLFHNNPPRHRDARVRTLRAGVHYVFAYGLHGLGLTAVLVIALHQHIANGHHSMILVASELGLWTLLLFIDIALILRTIMPDRYLRNDEKTPLLSSVHVINGEEISFLHSVHHSLRDDTVFCCIYGMVASLDATASELPAPVTRRLVSLPSAHGRQFEFIDYEAHLFAALRELHPLSSDEYRQSLWGDERDRDVPPMVQFVSRGGQSGAFFFKSYDSRLIVKTVSIEERDGLVKLLPAYHAHLADNPTSLLTRYCGLYGIRISREQRVIYFVVQLNVEHPSHLAAATHFAFDLKGSTHNRSVAPAGRLPCPSDRTHVGQKFRDNDLGLPLELSIEAYTHLSVNLALDAAFLHTHSLIDYSLLVAVHVCRPDCLHSHPMAAGAAALRLRYGQPAVWDCHQVILNVGIIDLLQPYSRAKRLERWFKTKILRVDPQGLSVSPPDAYADRFIFRILRHHFRVLWPKASTPAAQNRVARPMSPLTHLSQSSEDLLLAGEL
ncbi:uncharacterized protein MONBRDRAFT_36298 [Monosiga brevicollis MX1]|uniref:PIPK domain-containing protein n=1 Tax=Monosiga brevicollis TaxID=81824 RepID=A9UUR7_MONBE|nr:uncharacterized protein MONBRDRAFT_36298 [Monosiga brevicollis MX1]EDQ90768.1 predicted protein [Monosiga brevicollis MX1]|eukprot:XP_001744065.1 hypothetical protein [Monosiga brevicollis MX1]